MRKFACLSFLLIIEFLGAGPQTPHEERAAPDKAGIRQGASSTSEREPLRPGKQPRKRSGCDVAATQADNQLGNERAGFDTSTLALVPLDLLQGDFGQTVENLLHYHTPGLYGFDRPLAGPAGFADAVPRELAAAQDRQLLSQGLTAQFVTRNVAWLGDMMAFFPDDINYSHLIICIEQVRSGTTPQGNGGLNASVQRVNVRTGTVETMLHGMSRCDGIRRTPWGTILATEEAGNGNAYEIINPLETTGHWLADRAGDIRDGIDSPTTSASVARRDALPRMSWEGLTVLKSGVVIAGDELRPGSGVLDRDGGSIFKFVPDFPRSDENDINDLSDSPLVSGQVFAMQISCLGESSSNFPQYGQGCEVGQGVWVQVNGESAREDAWKNGATAYYRPEDLHADPFFEGEGIRFCWTNTGDSRTSHFGEVMCAVDQNPLPANRDLVEACVGSSGTFRGDGLLYLADADAPPTQCSSSPLTVVSVNRFIEGDPRFNSPDNLAFQPLTGNVYVTEDAQFGEIFACLPDHCDRDIKSDGCVSMLSVTDPLSEPTGFLFDGTGEVAFYIVQHGETPDALQDYHSNPVDGRTADLIRITGFQVNNAR